MALAGWFERSGSCVLQLGITPIAANGSSLPVVQLSVPLSIPAPTRYAFESTGQLMAKLAPALLRAGLGSVCEGTTSTGATGVTTLGGDLQILIRGGAIDVSCSFRTAQVTLGGGVRLVEMRWVSNRVGDLRCAPMTLPLQTGAGTSPPTTSPQSFGVILDRIILEGPAGLTLNDLLRGG